MSLTDEIFTFVQGSTDSEWCFAVFLNQVSSRFIDVALFKP